jgi:hypothetical protein
MLNGEFLRVAPVGLDPISPNSVEQVNPRRP